MHKIIIMALISLLFLGCKQKAFNIYEELAYNTIPNLNTNFLSNLVVGNISYSDDKLTPDLAGGRLFEDRNITKLTITKYFKYSVNRTFDHSSSIWIDLKPEVMQYLNNYIDNEARLAQITSCKAPILVIVPHKKQQQIKCCDGNSEILPKGLLPPRLPDLSIGIENPDVPD